MLCVWCIYLPDNLIINTEKERKSSIYLYIIFPDNFSEYKKKKLINRYIDVNVWYLYFYIYIRYLVGVSWENEGKF